MVAISWIVCVLVVSSAIPLIKRDEVTQTSDRNTVLAGENTQLKGNRSFDEKHGGGSREAEYETTHPEHHHAVYEADVMAFINRSNITTDKFHVGMRRMYHMYTQGTAGKHDMSFVSALRDHVVNNIPGLRVSNATSQVSNADTINKQQTGVKNTNNTDTDQVKTQNTTAAQEKDQRNEKLQIQLKGKSKDIMPAGQPELPQSNGQIAYTFSANAAQTTLVAPNVNEAPVTSCQHVPSFNKPRFLQMVVSCPKHWTELDIQLKCHSWDDLNTLSFMNEMTFLPVQDESGTVYANVYCAMCNSVSFFLPWTTSIVCNTASTESFQIIDFTDLVPLYSQLDASACERQIFPSFPESLNECDKVELNIFAAVRKDIDDMTAAISTNYPVSFNVLMNFDFTGKTHILFTASQTVIQLEYIPRCKDGQLYDPYAENCRQITCNRFYTLVGNKCVRNGTGSGSPDGLTNLSQLRTVDIVTLQVNITFQDFLIMKFKDMEPEIVPQIAARLNISVDRIKDVNITYELGSINGSALQVTTLTEAEYKGIFPRNRTYNIRSPSWDEVRTTEAPSEEWTSEPPEAISDANLYTSLDETLQAARNRNMKSDNFTQDTTKPNRVEQASRKFNPLLSTPYEALIMNGQKENKVNHGDGLTKLPQPRPNTRKTKKPYVPKNGVAFVNGQRTNFSVYDMILKRKLLNYHGLMVSMKYDNFFRYHFKSPDGESDLYISSPVNEKNERISVLVKDSLSFQELLQQCMTMRISFALVSPDDPLSNEAGSTTLLQMIDNLIFEQRFSLTLNGNDVEVVAVDDDRNKTVDDAEFCSWGVEYIVYDDEFMLVTVGNLTLLYVNKTNSYISVGLFDLFIIVSGSNDAKQTNVTGMVRYAFVCCMPRILDDCSRIDLERKEYYFAGPNKSIIFEGREYDIFEYRVLDEKTGSVQICVPPTFTNHSDTILPRIVTVDAGCSSDFDGTLRAEGHMTLMLGRISTFALCCVLLTYILLPALRNLPGLNMMSLTVCLLVSQIIFAEGIGTDTDWLCKTVAVSLHYTLLAAHFWMNVISYDVYKTFTSPITMTHTRERGKYFPRYSLYAWGTPLIIVTVCVIVDFSGLFHGVSIGYGDTPASTVEDERCHNCTDTEQDDINNINKTLATDDNNIHSCWITQPLAALVAFGSIILVIFLVNCIFFVKTIICISKTTKMARDGLTTRNSNSSFRKLSARSEVMLYVRMSTVMGFTWVFGLSSSILSSFLKPPTYTACAVIHLVVILFIILNTSQGFFIFVAFVCNQRVFGRYRDCIHRVINLRHKQIGRPFVTSSSGTVLSHQNS